MRNSPMLHARLVILESPYTGDIERNTAYARAAMTNSLNLGECPFLGHLLYTQVLDDLEPAQCAAGIAAHLAWMRRADGVVVYTDLGISPGMEAGIAQAKLLSLPLTYRTLYGWCPEATLAGL